jgi:hypothetical protein
MLNAIESVGWFTISCHSVLLSHEKEFNSFQLVRFEVYTAVTMKNAVFWDVTLWALVRTDASGEFSTSVIRVTTIR